MRRAALILLLTAASHAYSQQACPIGLYAERHAQAAFESTSQTLPQQGPSQGLHVVLRRIGSPAILSIDATLYGASPDPRILPLAAHSAADITRTFHLQRKEGEETLSSFDLSIRRVGSLRWVDITAITFADGTTWRSPRPALCRAVPSPLLLVAAR